ncbi:hypothetical protein EJ04DRAFT_551582 [Polyplosphaeria fusca]|uniref:RTA1-like protein n=1 Tax=Polyplosphaeria fusca TaxID=682080 RepID=A0A9P4R2Z3_9PLEO|nr:hypothetical protein EJ04DRAFT_551582 [Polyplosphaeria fusca]
MSATLNIPSSVLLAREETSKSCESVEPGKYGYRPPGSCDALYHYNPSFALAAAFTAGFALTTAVHIFQAILYKKRFCAVIIMGALWELLSFGLRTIGTRHQDSVVLASLSFTIFALAPLWINAFVYMVAGRLIFCFHPEKRVFKLNAVSIGRIFILGDIAAFIIQAGGATLIGPGADNKKLIDIGLRVYQAGIGIQQAFVILFTVVLIAFHKAMVDMEKGGWTDSPHYRKWKLMVWVLYLVLILITARIAYRLAEFIIDFDNNPLLENEFYMYVLDAVPMFIALLALNLVHPGRVLVGPESNYHEGKKAFKAHKKADKRAAKMAKKGLSGSDDEEESMIGIELRQQQAQQHAAWAPQGGPSSRNSPQKYHFYQMANSQAPAAE